MVISLVAVVVLEAVEVVDDGALAVVQVGVVVAMWSLTEWKLVPTALSPSAEGSRKTVKVPAPEDLRPPLGQVVKRRWVD